MAKGKQLARNSHLRCPNNIPIDGKVGCFLKVVVNPPLEVFAFGYGRFNRIMSSARTNNRQHEVTIENFRTCTCLGFVSMVVSSLGQ
jgi:hypothetical protein